VTEAGIRRFPDGFLWGTASAAHQVEGDNRNNDWWEFEQEPGRIAHGDSSAIACDHYHRYREDFALLREMNQNAHRLSIEWSRIEPSQGEFDSRQIRHYRDVLGELREQGMQPMVTLHHFTSPLWFTRKGGWAAPGAAHAFMPFVHRVIDELGDLIGVWCTINEPNIYGANGWVVGEFPPGRHGDIAGLYRVTGNMRRAHELAYSAIKRRWPDTMVGLSHHKFLMLPASEKGRAFDARLPKEQFIRRFNVPGVPVTDMGWSTDPKWMRAVLNELRPLGKPVYITENGLASSDDEWRQRYLQDVLSNVLLAIEDGVDVRGYFHWTNMDNFEWARGYAMRFGLIDVDRNTLERRLKPSGKLYTRIAQANGLPR